MRDHHSPVSLKSFWQTLGLIASLPLLAASATASQSNSDAPATAQRIDQHNIAALSRRGNGASAGLGDWWLSNGIVCAAISDLKHDAGIAAGGGNLVDLSHCGRNNDQWVSDNIIAGMSKDNAPQAERIYTEQQGQKASVLVASNSDGVSQVVRYSLEPGAKTLDIEVSLERQSKGERKLGLSAMLVLHPSASLLPFSLNTEQPQYSHGFQLLDIDRNNVRSLAKGMMPADWTILSGSDDADSISYGIQFTSATLHRKDGSQTPLPRFQINSPDYSVQGWTSRPPWIGKGRNGDNSKLGLLELAQTEFMDLPVGDRIVANYRILPMPSASVSAVTDNLYQGKTLSGSTGVAASSITVFDHKHRPVTQSFSDANGDFSLRLPAKMHSFKVLAQSPWGEVSELFARAGDSVELSFKERAELRLPKGPMRLSVFSADNNERVKLYRDPRGFALGDKQYRSARDRHELVLSGSADDPSSLWLPLGEYRVIADRGPEFSLGEARLELKAGLNRLDIQTPQRQVNPGIWRSADLHVHAEHSFDTTLPTEEQFKRYLASGSEILVLSDHNRIAKPLPSPAPKQLQIISGLEFTGTARTATVPMTSGHSNAFPVIHDPQAYEGGIVRIEDQRLHSLIASSKARWPQSLYQLNHPRSADPVDADQAFFNHLSINRSYDPTQPLDSDNNRSLLERGDEGYRDVDFELLEMLNGSSMAAYQQIKKDWFSLLLQGHRSTATANSDSHEYTEPAGIPRNYVRLEQGDLPLAEAAITTALKAGHSIGSSGPLLSVSLNGAGPGETITATNNYQLDISWQRADWVAVDTLKLYINGELRQQQAIGDHGLQHSVSLNPELTAGDFVVVEISGTADEHYRQLYPGIEPLAFSNPIWVQ